MGLKHGRTKSQNFPPHVTPQETKKLNPYAFFHQTPRSNAFFKPWRARSSRSSQSARKLICQASAVIADKHFLPKTSLSMPPRSSSRSLSKPTLDPRSSAVNPRSSRFASKWHIAFRIKKQYFPPKINISLHACQKVMKKPCFYKSAKFFVTSFCLYHIPRAN